MRIVHVVDSLEVGGAETIVVQLCRIQRESGHEPSVSCLYALGPLAHNRANDLAGVPVHLHGPASTPTLALRLRRHFRNLRPDVVHCHNATATIAAAPSATTARARVVSTRHGLVPPPLNRSRKYWLAARFCDHVVAVCNAARENLVAGAPPSQRQKLVTVYNGVAPLHEEEPEAPSFPDSVRSAEQERVGLISSRPQSFTLLTVGRLNPIKAHSVLLESLAFARKDIPHLQLWIVGDGPERVALEALTAKLQISGAVKFWGEQRNVAPFLTRADLFVISSDSEGLPMSLLEAMCAGRACLTTEVGGMVEVIRDSGCGELVPLRDPQAMAAAIARLARSPDQLRAYGQAARAAWQQRFTLERMAADYERLYSAQS